MQGDLGRVSDFTVLIALAFDSPIETVERAEQLRATALTDRDRAICARALGIAFRILGDARRAEEELREGLRHAQACGDLELEALTEMTLAVTLLYRGRSDESMSLFETAREKACGITRALVMSEQGGALLRLGRTADGLALLDSALPSLLTSSDPTDAADALTNRGIARAFLGEFDDAEHDLRLAQDRYVHAGARLHAARMTWNLAFVASRRGDLAVALGLFERATSEIRDAGGDSAELATDQCGVLLTAGLTTEARESAVIAVAGCRAGGRDADLAEALLLLARCALAGDDLEQAWTAAAEATALFDAQHRVGWSHQAAVLSCRARMDGGDVNDDLANELAVHAAALRSLDGKAATEALVLRLLVLAHLGRHADVAVEAAEVDAVLPLELDIARTLALAVSARNDGRRRDALAIVHKGLSALDQHRAVLASTELRTRAAAHVVQLAHLGTALALEGADPSDVLLAVEAQRAQAMRFQRLAPPRDLLLADLLVQLREALARRNACSGDVEAAAAIDRERERLERSIQARARLEQGPLRKLDLVASFDRIREALHEDEVLVEMIVHGPDVLAIIVDRVRTKVERLATGPVFARWVQTLPRAHWRVVSNTGDDRLLQQSTGQLESIMSALDGLLRPLVGDAARVVLSPAAAHHAVPWRLVPVMAERPVTIVPSATAFVDIRRRPARTPSSVLAVAGPDLALARRETAAIADLYPATVQLVQTDSAGITRAMAEADVAHFACHGRFRHGNPMLSALVLDGGPLTVYELERAGRMPDVVVLSACHLGLSAAYAGDELAGLTQVLLGLGSRAVIASVTPTPDAPATVALMVALHRRLAGGSAPSEALLLAATDAGPEAALISGAFGVFGA